MKSLRMIYKAYKLVDDYLALKEGTTVGRAKKRWADARTINDQAYFVVIFAQLEDHVNDQCARLIGRKRSASWPRRRLWENLDLDRIRFMDKVALLVDKGTAEYGGVKKYYDTRCDLAHGKLYSASPIAVPTIVVEFRKLASRLRTRV